MESRPWTHPCLAHLALKAFGKSCATFDYALAPFGHSRERGTCPLAQEMRERAPFLNAPLGGTPLALPCVDFEPLRLRAKSHACLLCHRCMSCMHALHLLIGLDAMLASLAHAMLASSSLS